MPNPLDHPTPVADPALFEQRAHWAKVIHYPATKAEQRDGWGIECQVCDYACGPFVSFEEADEYARKHENLDA